MARLQRFIQPPKGTDPETVEKGAQDIELLLHPCYAVTTATWGEEKAETLHLCALVEGDWGMIRRAHVQMCRRRHGGSKRDVRLNNCYSASASLAKMVCTGHQARHDLCDKWSSAASSSLRYNLPPLLCDSNESVMNQPCSQA